MYVHENEDIKKDVRVRIIAPKLIAGTEGTITDQILTNWYQIRFDHPVTIDGMEYIEHHFHTRDFELLKRE